MLGLSKNEVSFGLVNKNVTPTPSLPPPSPRQQVSSFGLIQSTYTANVMYEISLRIVRVSILE